MSRMSKQIKKKNNEISLFNIFAALHITEHIVIDKWWDDTEIYIYSIL